MSNVGEFISKVTIARPNSPSVRTTIPEAVVKMIDLTAKDSLLWKVNIKAGKVEIIVSKK